MPHRRGESQAGVSDPRERRRGAPEAPYSEAKAVEKSRVWVGTDEAKQGRRAAGTA